MKTKRLLAALMASALMVSMAACSSEPAASDGGEGGEEAGGEGGYRISMILKTNSAEFWKVIQAGAEAYAEEHPDLIEELSIKGPRPRPAIRNRSTRSRPTCPTTPMTAT